MKTISTQNNNDVIVINRMYVGRYLNFNLGHEIINMYRADDEKYYLYLNSYGSFAKKWTNRIKQMLLVKYHSNNCVEVIGKAIGLTDIYNYEEDLGNKNGEVVISLHQKELIENVRYNGVSLKDIFSNAERQNVYITFEADKVYRIKSDKRIYIHYLPQEKKNGEKEIKDYPKQSLLKLSHQNEQDVIDVWLSNNKLALASLSQFFENTGSVEVINDYSVLNSLFDTNDGFWELVDKVKIPSDYTPRQDTLFDICCIQDNENAFSNAIKYFMEQPEYRELWSGFFSEFCDANISCNYKVIREKDARINGDSSSGGRIDIFITEDEREENILIIENKIKSGINKNDKDFQNKKDQLDRYQKYAESKINRQYKIVLLAPDYKESQLKEELHGRNFKIVTYSKLYDYLCRNYDVWGNDNNFRALVDVIQRHTNLTEKEYLYQEMQEKFYSRII